MAKLDKRKPYGTIHGIHEARFSQDGVLYDTHGKPLNADPDPVESTDETIIDDPVEDSLDALAWQKVKSRVEDAGGHWTNKIEGVKFLRSL